MYTNPTGSNLNFNLYRGGKRFRKTRKYGFRKNRKQGHLTFGRWSLGSLVDREWA
jgi:hypothetical protein